MEFELRRPDSKLVNRNWGEDPMACTVELDRVAFSQFRIVLICPVSRSRICRPEKSVAPAAATDGDNARRESMAENCVRIVVLL